MMITMMMMTAVAVCFTTRFYDTVSHLIFTMKRYTSFTLTVEENNLAGLSIFHKVTQLGSGGVRIQKPGLSGCQTTALNLVLYASCKLKRKSQNEVLSQNLGISFILNYRILRKSINQSQPQFLLHKLEKLDQMISKFIFSFIIIHYFTYLFHRYILNTLFARPLRIPTVNIAEKSPDLTLMRKTDNR